MVDFQLTDEQKQYQQLARDFARNEIMPASAQLDRQARFPGDILRQAWELGLINLRLPEDCGGLALSVFDSCLIFEELGSACTGVGAILSANELAQAPLVVAGTQEQKERFLKKQVDEFALATTCIAGKPFSQEPAIEARRHGDSYVLNGIKEAVVAAGNAAWFCLLAAVDGDSHALMIVPASSEGISIEKPPTELGQRAACASTVAFRDVMVPLANLVGLVGQGHAIWQQALNTSGLNKAAQAVGLARQALAHSIQYSKERHTFGQPIANHQAVSFMLADMAKDIEAARLLCWQAAWLAGRRQENSRAAAIAQAFAADTAMKVATDAVQLYGGYGYSSEYPVEKLMRDAKLLQIQGETTAAARVVIGKQLAGVL